jgi:hypothetical protein
MGLPLSAPEFGPMVVIATVTELGCEDENQFWLS